MANPLSRLHQQPSPASEGSCRYRVDIVILGVGMAMLALSLLVLTARPSGPAGASLNGWFRVNDDPFYNDEVRGACFVNLSNVAWVLFSGRGPNESVKLYTEDGHRCDNGDFLYGWRSEDVRRLHAALQRRTDRWIAVNVDPGADTDTYVDLTRVVQVRLQKPSPSYPPLDRSVKEVAYLYGAFEGSPMGYRRLGVVDRKDTLAQLKRMMKGGMTKP